MLTGLPDHLRDIIHGPVGSFEDSVLVCMTKSGFLLEVAQDRLLGFGGGSVVILLIVPHFLDDLRPGILVESRSGVLDSEIIHVRLQLCLA